MVTTSYPRFPGDSVGTFMDPIAKSVAARGHAVHIVAPWHPLVARNASEDGVHFHFFRYAPVPSLNIFGYAEAMRADVSVRAAAYVAAPLAVAAGVRAARKIARRHGATIVHGHWVVPGGFIAAAGAPGIPLVVSLHGSDVYVAETFAPAAWAARRVFSHAAVVTACSADLGRRAVALGADADHVEVIPYGVDVERFGPRPSMRASQRARLDVTEDALLVFAAGRLVRKKGFEYLIDAVPLLRTLRRAVVVIAGDGDLRDELAARARSAGAGDRVRFAGNLTQDEVAVHLAAADIVVVPSVRDDSGNVDGLPNVVLEALAAGAPLIATAAGGIGAVVEDRRSGILVPERDPNAIAAAISQLADDPSARTRLGEAGRLLVATRFGWDRVAERLEAAYERALARKSADR
jgi:glycosyltransferase involved in cell wall biosynthesis